jgi:hypothetical protein
MPIKVEATITETTQADLEWLELVREKAHARHDPQRPAGSRRS